MFKYLKYMFMAAIVSVAATGCQEDPEDAFSTAPTAPELVNNGKILMTQNTMTEDVTWAWSAARFFNGSVKYTLYMQYADNTPLTVGETSALTLSMGKEAFRSLLEGQSYLPKNDSYSVTFFVTASDGESSATSDKQSATIYAYGDAVSAIAIPTYNELVLDVNDPTGIIDLLSWDAARLNYNETITYGVELSYNGGEAVKVASDVKGQSYAITVDGLNELVVAAGAPEGEASDVQLFVVAYSDSYPAGVPSAPATIKVTTYVATFPDCYYLPGSYQGWKPELPTCLTLPQSSTQKGLFEAFVDLTTEDGGDVEFKFSPVPAWEGDFGSDDFTVSTDKGFAVGSGNSMGRTNIKVPSGFYRISLNKKLNKLEMVQVNTVGLIGGMTGWGSEIKMDYDAATNSYSTVATISEGDEYKFRINDNWDYAIGEGGLMGEGVKNLVMDKPTGEYKVVVSVASHPYKIQLVSTAFPTEEFIYVPGNHQGWSPATAAALKTTKFDGVYTGYSYMDGEFKFTKIRDWKENLEYNTDHFSTYNGAVEKGAKQGGNMNCTKAGFYQIVANVMDATLTFTETSWGIIGPAQPGGWNDDTNMTYNKNEDCWETTVELAADYLKFRANDGWNIDVGGSLNDLTEKGADIMVPEAGTYEVKLYLSRTTTDKMYCTLTKK